MKFFTTIFFLAILCHFLPAQNDADNLAKYWQYRNTYKKQFVFVGENAGQSIPFATLYPDEDISWSGAWNHHLACFPRPSGNGGLTTGDATLQLGIYMAVLSTEYALLKKDNISTEGIERELYYALKAFQRLDVMAEPFFGNPGENDPTFYLRDDIPVGFVKDSSGNFYIRNYFAASPNDSVIRVAQGDYSCGDLTTEENYPGVTSQDQTTHLSLGFVMIQKYVDEEAEYNGVNLKEFGKQVYTTLFQGYKDNFFIAGKPMQVDELWRFDYRSLLQAVYPFRRVMNNFFDGNELNTTQDKTSWLNLFLPVYILSDKSYNNAMGLIWAAIGDAANNDTWLSRQCKEKHLELYALVNACLYDKEVGELLTEDDFKRLLDVAPCNLPCGDPRTGCPSAHNLDWNVGYRWTNNSRNSDQGWQNGFFNGIDYMLLYNLFHLKYRSDLTYYPPPPPPCDFYNDVPFDSLPAAVPTGIRDHTSKEKLVIYPNPGKDKVRIDLPKYSGSLQLILFTADGRIAKTVSISDQKSFVEINVSALPAQVYFLQVKSKDEVWIEKWVKK